NLDNSVNTVTTETNVIPEFFPFEDCFNYYFNGQYYMIGSILFIKRNYYLIKVTNIISRLSDNFMLINRLVPILHETD
ncbi:hypothetical protein BpHYR1_036609, partial [Brachionus plicatilis]